MTLDVRGCGTAIGTPFTRLGEVDDDALRNHVEWQLESGVDFRVPCGSTGEAQTLSPKERRKVIEATVDAADAAPKPVFMYTVPGRTAVHISPETVLLLARHPNILTVVVDLVKDQMYRHEERRPLEIPAGAVVVPGMRPVRKGPGADAGIAFYAPAIVKHPDEKSDTSVQLKELLR